MANELVVRIIGDASSLNRAMAKASSSTKKFDKDVSHTFRGVVAGSGAFRSLGRSVAFASAGFLGGVGLTALVRGAFEEMSNVQKAAAQTNAVLKSTGGVAGVTAEHVDKLAKSLLNISGVDDEVIKGAENILLTFTNIRRVAGAGNDIFDRAAKSALNLSVRFNTDLPTAAKQLGRALQDPERGLTALSRSGVSFSTAQRKVIKSLVESGNVLEAQKIILREVEKETGGAAAAAGDTLAGKFNILRETVRNVGGDIALQLLPAITKTVDRLLAWVRNTENQQRVLRASQQVIGAVTTAFNVLRGVFEGLNKVTGSTKHTLELLIGVFVAFKVGKVVAGFVNIAGAITGVGNAAVVARGKVLLLDSALLGPAGVVALGGAALIVLQRKAQKIAEDAQKAQNETFKPGEGLEKTLVPFIAKRINAAKKAGKDSMAILIWLRQWLGNTRKANDLIAEAFRLSRGDAALLAKLSGGPRAPAGALGPVGRRGADAPGAEAARAAAAAAAKAARERAKEARARIRQANEAARDAALERADLAVSRAQATKTLTDDLVALRKENALIARRIRGGHDTIALERQQLDVQNQITAVLQQQAEARKAQEQARAQARSTRQFRLLGFGPGGEDLVPGVKSLKKQLQAATKALDGTFLDTRKTQSIVARISKILGGGLGKVGKDVRQKIQDIINDLKDQLRNQSVDVTKFTTAGRGQFALAGAHPTGIVVNGGIHLHGIQNVKELENALAKRTKQRAHKRRAV